MMLLPLIGGLLLQNAAILVKSFPTSPLSRMKPQQLSPATSLAPLQPSSSQLAMRSMSVVLGKQEQQNIPKLGKNGLYLITNEEEYRTLLNHNADKLIVLKVFAPWCKTCKALAPKFQALARGLSGCGTTTTNGADVALPSKSKTQKKQIECIHLVLVLKDATSKLFLFVEITLSRNRNFNFILLMPLQRRIKIKKRRSQ